MITDVALAAPPRPADIDSDDADYARMKAEESSANSAYRAEIDAENDAQAKAEDDAAHGVHRRPEYACYANASPIY